MKQNPLPSNRRQFIKSGTVFSLGGILSARGASKDSKPEPKRKPPLEESLIRQFVRSSHSQADDVKQLLEHEPRLINAAWDWGNGDFETALGAASHMGRFDIADLLIAAGARTDLFYYATKGNHDLLRSAILADSTVVNQPGPHGISLFFHAAISGSILTVELLEAHGAELDNGSLIGAVRYGKSYEMAAWLLDRGVTYHGQKGFGKEPLADWARQQGQLKLANLLDAHFTP